MKLKPSFISYIQNYFLVCLILIAIFFVSSSFPSNVFTILDFVFILVAIFLLLEPIYERCFYTYEVNENSIIETNGILTKKQTTMPIENVSDIEIIKTPLGRIFGFGNICIKGFRGDIVLKGIKDPEKVYNFLKGKITKKQS